MGAWIMPISLMGIHQFPLLPNTISFSSASTTALSFVSSRTKLKFKNAQRRKKAWHKARTTEILPCPSLFSKLPQNIADWNTWKCCVIYHLAFFGTHFALWSGFDPAIAEEASENQIQSLPSPTAAEPVTVPASSLDTLQSKFIEILIFLAFLGLVALTLGAVYLVVSEFLESRQRKKLKNEEEKKPKEKTKKAKLAKSGPKGFGQRLTKED